MTARAETTLEREELKRGQARASGFQQPLTGGRTDGERKRTRPHTDLGHRAGRWSGSSSCPPPAPGSIIVALGAGLIAQDSLADRASALDWLELRIRALIAWAHACGSARAAARTAIVLGGLVIAAGGAYGCGGSRSAADGTS